MASAPTGHAPTDAFLLLLSDEMEKIVKSQPKEMHIMATAYLLRTGHMVLELLAACQTTGEEQPNLSKAAQYLEGAFEMLRPNKTVS